MQPTQLGPYTIGTRLGRGGMGAVYEATDDAGRRVAVKLLASHLADDPGLRRRFDAEIATLKQLRHPGIVQLLAFGEEDDQPYFAMELVPGSSLEQLLRSGRRFSWRETVSVAIGVARALKAAHDHGVVHRDLKPANLLVADGDAVNLGERVKLADFGIAKLFGGATHTAHGNIVGTAEYMAPEQAAGTAIDHRVDIYALGLVMFAMLTGRPPFTGGQIGEILRRQQREPPPRVSSLVPDVPHELDELLARMLAKAPADRPPNALALARLLAAVDTLHDPPADTGPLTALPLPGDTAAGGVETPGAVDLYAATAAITAPVAGGPRGPEPTAAATGMLAGSTTKPVDAVPPPGTLGQPAAATVVEGGPKRRFTTVEELDRVAAARLARERAAEQRWQAVAAVVTLAALAAGGYLLFKPPTADELFGRIEAGRIAAEQGADLRDAASSIDAFIERFPDDPRIGQVRSLARGLAIDRLEKRARRRPLGPGPLEPIERDYRAAMEREADSPSACRDALEALVALHAAAARRPDPAGGTDPSLWLDLARRQIDRLAAAAAQEEAEDGRKIAAIFREAESLAAAAAGKAGADRAGLIARRRDLLESVIDLYGTRPHAAPAVAKAKTLLAGPE